jgi:uncharacterized protein YndB with AHSA1/START domain
MENTRTLQVTTPSDREIVMTREFNAPRRLVFDAWTKPELIERWLGVMDGWSMPVCEVDLRVGGAYRFVWSNTDGQKMGLGGVYQEVTPPERLVNTEAFDEPWYPGEALVTLDLAEQNGRTTATMTVRYDSREIRDAVLKTPMASGIERSYAALDEVLASHS